MSMTNKKNGFTLIELMVSVGLFSIITLLTASAYFMMLSINRQTQGIATGINNLSFALETMTHTIRTGTGYGCPSAGTDCPPSGGTSFSLTDENGVSVSYRLGGTPPNQYIQKTVNGVSTTLTDPSVTVSSLLFYAFGTKPFSGGSNRRQPYVTIIVSGTVSYGPGKTQSFTIETGATMRGTDL